MPRHFPFQLPHRVFLRSARAFHANCGLLRQCWICSKGSSGFPDGVFHASGKRVSHCRKASSVRRKSLFRVAGKPLWQRGRARSTPPLRLYHVAVYCISTDYIIPSKLRYSRSGTLSGAKRRVYKTYDGKIF